MNKTVKIFLILLTALCYNNIKAQTIISTMDSDRYLSVNDLPNTYKTKLYSSDSLNQGTIITYNIFFKTDTSQYLLVLSLLPNQDSKHPFLDTPLDRRDFKRNEITHEELKKMVLSTVQTIRQESKIFNFVRPELFYSDYIIPVSFDEETSNYEVSCNRAVSELFIISSKEVPYSKEDFFTNDYDKLQNEVIPYFQPNTININNPVINYESLAEVNVSVHTDEAARHGGKIPSEEESLDNPIFNKFLNIMFLQEKDNKDSVYYFRYSPGFSLHSDINYSLRDIYYDPQIGIVGASYDDYFRSFYDWIPNAEYTGRYIYRDKRRYEALDLIKN